MGCQEVDSKKNRITWTAEHRNSKKTSKASYTVICHENAVHTILKMSSLHMKKIKENKTRELQLLIGMVEMCTFKVIIFI